MDLCIWNPVVAQDEQIGDKVIVLGTRQPFFPHPALGDELLEGCVKLPAPQLHQAREFIPDGKFTRRMIRKNPATGSGICTVGGRLPPLTE